VTKDQIKMIRDYSCKPDGRVYPDGKEHTMAFSLSAIFNNEITFCNTDNMVIYDDDNALIHCLMPNTTDVVIQSIAPYKINTGFYDNIQYLEGIYDMTNFKKAVKELFLDTGLIEEEQQAQIENWAESIRNSVPDSNPIYFKDTVLPIPKAHHRKARYDGVEQVSVIGHETENMTMENVIITYMDNLLTSKTCMIKDGKLNYIYNKIDTTDIANTIIAAAQYFAQHVTGFQQVSVYAFGDPRVCMLIKDRQNITFADDVRTLCSGITAGRETTIRFLVKGELTDCICVFRVDDHYLDNWLFRTNNAVNKYILKYVDEYNVETRVAKTDMRGKDITKLDFVEMRSILDTADSRNIVKFNSNTVIYKSGGDDTTWNSFKNMIINSVPGVDETSEFTVTIERGVEMLTYKFKMTYVAPDECTLNGTNYHKLSDALIAANIGDTITLISNTMTNEAYILNKSVIINMNGFNMTSSAGLFNITNSESIVSIYDTHREENMGHLTASGDMITVASEGCKMEVSAGIWSNFDPMVSPYVDLGPGKYSFQTKDNEFSILNEHNATSEGYLGRKYISAARAIADIPYDGTPVTISLLSDCVDFGCTIGKETGEVQNVTIDLNNYTLAINNEPLAGSAGTKTCGLQLLKGSTVTIKNGNLSSSIAKMGIQNYSNLTLENVTMDFSESDKILYAMSNNFGNVTIKGNTVIKVPEGKVAFDMWYGMSPVYEEGIDLKFVDFTGAVVGKVEYGAQNTPTTTGKGSTWMNYAKLSIEGSTDTGDGFNVTFVDSSDEAVKSYMGGIQNANIKIKSGKFTNEPHDNYIDSGSVKNKVGDVWVVSKLSKELIAKREIDSEIDKISVEGMTITKTGDGEYDIDTNTREGLNNSGIIEFMAGRDGVTKIEATDGDAVATLTTFTEEAINTFKAAVLDMVPQDMQTKQLTFQLTF